MILTLAQKTVLYDMVYGQCMFNFCNRRGSTRNFSPVKCHLAAVQRTNYILEGLKEPLTDYEKQILDWHFVTMLNY